MLWYRRYHGTCRDPKLEKAARRAGVPRPYAIAAWEAICEIASQAAERGSVRALDPEELAIMIGCETAEAVALMDGFSAVGLLQADRIAGWDDSQYASDYSTDRVRRHRGKRSAAADDHGGAADETVVKRFRNGPEQSRQEQDQNPSSLRSEGDLATQSPAISRAVSRGTRLAANWPPSDADEKFALQQGLHHDELRHEADRFRDHWTAASGQRAVRCNWETTWRNWIRRAVEQDRSRPAAHAPGADHARAVGDQRPRPTGMLAGAAAVLHRRPDLRGSDR